MKHKKKILVNCWNCDKEFDIVTAERCYEHLNNDYWPFPMDREDLKNRKWTTKCSYCGACICHKVDKMQNVKCKVLNKVGITRVMPSVKINLRK